LISGVTHRARLGAGHAEGPSGHALRRVGGALVDVLVVALVAGGAAMGVARDHLGGPSVGLTTLTGDALVVLGTALERVWVSGVGGELTGCGSEGDKEEDKSGLHGERSVEGVCVRRVETW
jgi:hypothetical protein